MTVWMVSTIIFGTAFIALLIRFDRYSKKVRSDKSCIKGHEKQK